MNFNNLIANESLFLLEINTLHSIKYAKNKFIQFLFFSSELKVSNFGNLLICLYSLFQKTIGFYFNS